MSDRRLAAIGIVSKTAKIFWTFLGAWALICGLSFVHWLATPPATMRVQEPLPVNALDAGANVETATAAKGQAAWYRIPLRLDKIPADGLALFMPFPMANFQARLNGRDLTPPITVGAAGTPSQYPPRLIVLPPERLQSGDNELLLWIFKNRPQLDLPSVYLGNKTEIQPYFERHEWLKIRLLDAIIVAMLVISAIMAVFWACRRHETAYGWLALALLMGCCRLSYFSVETLPVSLRYWDWFGATALGSWTIAMVIFLLRLVEERHRWIETAMVAGIALLAVLLLVVDPGAYYRLGLGCFYTLLFVFWTYSIARLVAGALRGAAEANVLLVSGVMLIVLAGRDLLLVLGLWPRDYGVYIPYGVGLALVTYAWLLLRRFIRTLAESEQLSKSLERRVEEKHAELEQNYGRIVQLEYERVLASERERIMRDMHDGVGGQLMHLLASVEASDLDRTEMAAALSETLDDLRMLILSLDPSEPDLGTALASMRNRIQRAVKSHGVTLNWELDAMAELPALGPERTLHVVRIVQEAVNNALKHAHPHTLTIRAGLLQGCKETAYLSVTDDGCGRRAAQSESQGSGRGINNMTRRAELMGATLTIDIGEAGTTVRLIISPSVEVQKKPSSSTAWHGSPRLIIRQSNSGSRAG